MHACSVVVYPRRRWTLERGTSNQLLRELEKIQRGPKTQRMRRRGRPCSTRPQGQDPLTPLPLSFACWGIMHARAFPTQPPIDTQRARKMAAHLQTLFPEISEETLEAVLFQCGYDEDAAVTALLSMNEEPVPPSSAPPASTPAPVFACGGTTPPAGGLFTFGAGSGAAPVPESPALPPLVSPPAPPPASKAPVFAFGGTPPAGGGQFTFGASSGAPAAPAHPAAPVFGASVAPALGAPPARRRPPMRARLDSAETDLERHMLEAALAASRLDAGASAEPPAAPNLTVGAKVRYGGFRGCTVAVLHADGSVDINVPGVGIHSRVAAPSFQIDDDDASPSFQIDDEDDNDEDGDDGEYERVLMPERGRSVPPDSMEGVWSASYTAVSTSHHPTLRHGRGDKVLLPTTALAALTEAMEAQKGTPRLPNGPTAQRQHACAAAQRPNGPIHSCCGACMCAHCAHTPFPPYSHLQVRSGCRILWCCG